MIHGHTLNGTKDLTLRGWKGPRGLKGFVQGRITTAAGDKQFWDGTLATLTVTVDHPVVAGVVASHGSPTLQVITSPATASGSGGSPPYVYAWAHVSDDGNGGTWAARTPTTDTSTFYASAVPVDESSGAVFRCNVTDARGATGHVDVDAGATVYSV